MCGFVAVLDVVGVTTEADLTRMRDRLIHRGPDEGRTVMYRTSAGILGLGHRRLRIIDLSESGAQPMPSSDGRFVLVYNGELYNYIELRSELLSLGHQFRSQSDSEVLLQAYQEWGTACLSHFNGMYAFVIWDAHRQELFVARDRFGEKPLYRADLPGGGVALASEIKAFFAHPQIIACPDDEIVRAFASNSTDYASDRTMFRGIRKVPAATAVLYRADGTMVRAWRYWTPNYDEGFPALSAADAGDSFRERLFRSVRQRMRSDVCVGACLSGGLDSSTIVGMCDAISREPGGPSLHRAISARFDDDPVVSEGAYIDRVLRTASVVGESVTPTASGLASESRKLHWHQEEPFLSASSYLEWCVHRQARSSGCVVMLDGQGADELLGGYQYYFRLRQFDLMFKRRFGKMAIETLLFNTRIAREARKYANAERRINAKIGYGFRDLWTQWRAGTDPEWPVSPGVPVSRGGNTFRWQLASGMQCDMLSIQLHSADRNAMAFGVESRFPFLDYELVDWCSRLPDDVLIRWGWQKYPLRIGCGPYLPREIQWRVDKVGFAAPQDEWLRGDLFDWARDLLFSGPVTDLPYYPERTLADLWSEHQGRLQDRSWALWRWISLSEWLRMHADGTWRTGIH